MRPTAPTFFLLSRGMSKSSLGLGHSEQDEQNPSSWTIPGPLSDNNSRQSTTNQSQAADLLKQNEPKGDAVKGIDKSPKDLDLKSFSIEQDNPQFDFELQSICYSTVLLPTVKMRSDLKFENGDPSKSYWPTISNPFLISISSSSSAV